MSRGPSKAKQILQDAKNRFDEAASALNELRAQVRTAEAVYNAQGQAYYALEKAFSTERKTKPPKAVEMPQVTGKKCQCGEPADDPCHDRSYIKSHDFIPVQSVGKRLRRNVSAMADSAANGVTSSVDASPVAS